MINRSEELRATTTRTEILEDDPGTPDVDETGQVLTVSNSTGNRVKTERANFSYAGEASLAFVWKINNCFALRTGYEAFVVTGLEQADDAYLGIDDEHVMFFHGGFAGFEYRR